VSVASNARLAFARTDSDGFEFGNTIHGTGSVTVEYGCRLQLSGTNDYSGGTVINGGTLAAYSATNLGSGESASWAGAAGCCWPGASTKSTRSQMADNWKF